MQTDLLPVPCGDDVQSPLELCGCVPNDLPLLWFEEFKEGYPLRDNVPSQLGGKPNGHPTSKLLDRNGDRGLGLFDERPAVPHLWEPERKPPMARPWVRSIKRRDMPPHAIELHPIHATTGRPKLANQLLESRHCETQSNDVSQENVILLHEINDH